MSRKQRKKHEQKRRVRTLRGSITVKLGGVTMAGFSQISYSENDRVPLAVVSPIKTSGGSSIPVFRTGRPVARIVARDSSPAALADLHFVAGQIGIKREWYGEITMLGCRIPYYLITEGMRPRAIVRGATDLDEHGFAAFLLSWCL